MNVSVMIIKSTFFGTFILPPNVLAKKFKHIWKSHIIEFAERYKNDMPQIFDLRGELDLWKKFWETEHQKGIILPTTVQKTLLFLNSNSRRGWFPNIFVILIIIATCPGTSVSSERSFSKLRELKTYTRNSMKNERLTGLALLYIHRDIDIDMDNLMQEFCKDYKNTLFKRDLFID